MAFWSRKQQNVKPLAQVMVEWSSDILKIAWMHGLEEESTARLDSKLPPRDKAALKPAPSSWIPKALLLLGKSIGELDGWVYDEESRGLHRQPETDNYFPPPIMVETFTSLSELVEAVTVVAIFTRGQTLGLSDKQKQEVWNLVAQGVERHWRETLPDQFQLVTESCG